MAAVIGDDKQYGVGHCEEKRHSPYSTNLPYRPALRASYKADAARQAASGDGEDASRRGESRVSADIIYLPLPEGGSIIKALTLYEAYLVVISLLESLRLSVEDEAEGAVVSDVSAGLAMHSADSSSGTRASVTEMRGCSGAGEARSRYVEEGHAVADYR